jgi:hypothetical protein
MKHTVVVSDLHLWEAVDGDGLWMRYRQRRYFPDRGLVALFERLAAQCEDGSLELVLNGDVFDFDIARPDGDESPPRDERTAVARMHSILDDHEAFLDGLVAVLARGHSVVFVAGNHDLPMVLTAVRLALRERIERALRRASLDDATVRDCMDRVAHKGWFHRTRDGIHVEHGQQYDAYTSVPHPLWPVATRRPGDPADPRLAHDALPHRSARLLQPQRRRELSALARRLLRALGPLLPLHPALARGALALRDAAGRSALAARHRAQDRRARSGQPRQRLARERRRRSRSSSSTRTSSSPRPSVGRRACSASTASRRRWCS